MIPVIITTYQEEVLVFSALVLLILMVPHVNLVLQAALHAWSRIRIANRVMLTITIIFLVEIHVYLYLAPRDAYHVLAPQSA